MRGCHFAILDSGLDNGNSEMSLNGSSNALLMLLSILRQHHFKLVSRVEGGYAACHRMLIALDRRGELIDHDLNVCFECSGRYTGLKKEKSNIFDTVRKLAVNMRSRVETLNRDTNDRDSENFSRLEHREYHIPDSVSALSASVSIKLLLTILNDRSSEDQGFVTALLKLSDKVFAFALENLSPTEKVVNTGTQGLYSGIHFQSLYSITFTAMDEYVLNQIWTPFRTVLSRTPLICRFTPTTVKGKNPNEESGTRRTRIGIEFPSDFQPSANGNKVIIWISVFTPLHTERVLATVRYLRKHHLPTHQIFIACTCAARPALWRIADSDLGSSLPIYIGNLQEWREERLVPGWPNYVERVGNVIKDKMKVHGVRGQSKEIENIGPILSTN
jgi:hypothetical protein